MGKVTGRIFKNIKNECPKCHTGKRHIAGNLGNASVVCDNPECLAAFSLLGGRVQFDPTTTDNIREGFKKARDKNVFLDAMNNRPLVEDYKE